MRVDFKLTAEQRRDARLALGVLEGSGLSLYEAAKAAVASSGARAETVLVRSACERFLDSCVQRKLREKTLDDYGQKLETFAKAQEGLTMDEISRLELQRWLDSLPITIRPNFLRVVRAMFRWAARQNPPLVRVDPSVGLQLETVKRETSIDFITHAEAERIMQTAGRYQAFFALNLFAGLRPSEIRSTTKPPLLWEHIDIKSRTVLVPAKIAKSRRARLLEGLPANLWAWLRPVRGDDSEPVAPGAERDAVMAVRAAIETKARSWPADGCRHAFATYHVAMHSDVARTSLIMGHEGDSTMIHRHYRGLAKKADAQRFFKIKP